VGYVVYALQFLGQVITSFLKPGSPPRLLPDLDKWGKGAAEAWLEGWLDADFSLLREFGSTVSGLLTSMAAAGKMGETDIAPRTIGVQQAFAEIIHAIRETGTVSEELFAAIREQAGPAGEQVEELARRYARVGILTARLAEIQERLADLSREQAQQQDTARLGQLEEIIADPRATSTQRERARAELQRLGLLMEQREIEGELEDAQADLSNYKSRLDVESETLGLMGRQLSLMESLKDVLTSALDPLMAAVRGWQLQQAELQDLVRLAEIEHELAGDGLTVAQRTALELEKQAIQAERLVRARDAAELGVDLSGLANIPIVPEDFISSAKAAAGALGLPDGIEGAALGAIDGLEELTAFDLTEFTGKLDEMKLAFETGLEEGKASFEGLTGEAGIFGASLGDLGVALDALQLQIDNLEARQAELNKSLNEGGEASDKARRIGDLLSQAVQYVWTKPVDDLQKSWDGLKESWNELRQAADPLIQKANETLSALDNLWGLLGKDAESGLRGAWKALAGKLLELAMENSPFVKVKKMIDNVRTAVDLARGAIELLMGWWDRLRGVNPADVPAPAGGGEWQGSGLASGTNYWRGGLTKVGEQGMELVHLPEGARVFSAGQTQRMLAGSTQQIYVTVPGVVVRDQQDVAELAYAVAREIKWRTR
jgi:molybdopterin converting factor small subunit